VKKGMSVAVACPSTCDVSGSLLLGGKGKRRVKRLRKATLTMRLAVKAGGASQTVSRTVKLKR
jgi:hypothetical protein